MSARESALAARSGAGVTGRAQLAAWPDAIGEDVRTIGSYTPCAGGCRQTTKYCATLTDGTTIELTSEFSPGTWVFFGDAALCRSCAWARCGAAVPA